MKQTAKVFFFKQWGGKNKKKAGRELNGQIYNQMPDVELEKYI
jgi:protein gp37